MKKIFINTAFGLAISASLFAQNEYDALRFSRTMMTGTSRSAGMGGAIGAVGADFSSLSVNPAGIGLYRQSEFTFSPSIMWNNISSDFKGNKYDETRYNFNMGNFGYVMNNTMNENSGWISTNFGVGYNRINSFGGETFMSGINNNSSLLDNFAWYANNSSELSNFYEGLAYDAYLLPFDTLTNEYWNDFQNDGYGQLQRRNVETSGSMGEYVFSFGANYNHRLYMGATLGITRVRYDKSIIHNESDPSQVINIVDEFTFREDLRTRGTGYTLKLGVIGRPLDFLRVGAAFHLPVFYNLRDEFSTQISSEFDVSSGLDNQREYSPVNEYNYNLRTPSRFVGNAAITFGKFAMVSADYEYVDYTSAKLDASDYGFYDENAAISSTFRAAHNIRLGGELKLGSAYLRGGFANNGSPLATEQPGANGRINVYSLGTGVRSSDFFVDFNYSMTNSKERYYMYVPGMDDGSLNTSKLSNIMMTMGFRF